jgi:hypothetical protein
VNHITHERLLELLEYDPDTGIFKWKVNRKRLAKVGTTAGSINGSGYIHISVDGKLYLAHRLAWFYCFQEWPEKNIDHINGIRTDNRLDNLQDVSQNRYQAYIKVNGKTIHLGMFDTGEEAVARVVQYKEENNL